MSKPNHTPGPWEHTGQGDIVGKEDNGFGPGYVDVCSVYLRTVRGRTNANIRLIASAPELLGALQALTHSLDPDHFEHDDQREAFNQAVAAIAKATTGV